MCRYLICTFGSLLQWMCFSVEYSSPAKDTRCQRRQDDPRQCFSCVFLWISYSVMDSNVTCSDVSLEDTDPYMSKEPNRTGSTVVERGDLFYITLTLHIVITCLIIFSNCLVIAAVSKYKSLKSIGNVLMANLAVADLQTALLTIPINWIVFTGVIKPQSSRTIYCAAIVPLIASLVFMVTISIDRGMAIIKPFFHKRTFTKRRAYIFSVTLWVFCILLALSSLLFQEYLAGDREVDRPVRFFTPTFTTVMVAVYGVYFVIMTSLYGTISVIARRQAKRIWQQTHSDKARQKSEAKIRRMMITVLGVFYLCWTPQMVMLYVIYVHRYHPQWVRILEGVTELLCLANSCMNPVVYAYHDRRFRTAFKDLLRISISEEEKEILSGTTFLVYWRKQSLQIISMISTGPMVFISKTSRHDDE